MAARPDVPHGSAGVVAGDSPARRSPTRPLVVGLLLVLATIAGVGAYTFVEIGRLRDEQTAISERNRKDSLQLLRIQNDLASLAFLMRDMVEGTEPYPMHGWKPAFDRLQSDLTEALALERVLAPVERPHAQQGRLERLTAAYWASVDRMFALARAGDTEGATRLVRGTLTQQHRELTGMVAQFLVVNNRIQEEAARANRAIFDRVAREVLLLVAVLLVSVGSAGAWIIRANRRAFEEVRTVTAQVRALSWRTLRLQEDVQRSVSRELHDDFGQILTAVGTMLGRARRRLPPDAPILADLDEVRGIAQSALDRIRTRSQWLHPGVLDDFGLAKGLGRLAEQFERQTGVATTLSVSGPVDDVRDDYSIHVYRIVQEALANVSRHSGAGRAAVRLSCDADRLELEIEDHGRGLPLDAAARGPDRGIGLVSMRERAELMGGTFALARPAEGGLVVRVTVPEWARRDAAPIETPAQETVL